MTITSYNNVTIPPPDGDASGGDVQQAEGPPEQRANGRLGRRLAGQARGQGHQHCLWEKGS